MWSFMPSLSAGQVLLKRANTWHELGKALSLLIVAEGTVVPIRTAP